MRIPNVYNWLVTALFCFAVLLNCINSTAQDKATQRALAWIAEASYANPKTVHWSHALVAGQDCKQCHSGSVQLEGNFKWLAQASNNPLGVQLSPISPEFAGYLGLKSAVVLQSVPEDSPGYQGGLRQYDVVLEAQETGVDSPTKFDEIVTSRAGESLNIKVQRQGEKKQVTLTVPAIVASLDIVKAEQSNSNATVLSATAYRLGVVLADVDDALRAHLNLPQGEGLLITQVTDGGPAAKIGCEVNDIFLALDDQRLTSQQQLRELVQKIGDRESLLKLLRRGKAIEVKIKPKLVTEDSVVDYTPSWLSAYTGAIDQYTGAIDQASLNRRAYFELQILQQNAKPESETDGPARNIKNVKDSVVELQTKMADILAELEQLEKHVAAASTKVSTPEQPKAVEPNAEVKP